MADPMRVIFAGGGTGGHLYPGLAIARALVRLDPAMQPFFVGALRGIERDVLPTTEFPHVLLDLHPLYRARPWENWKTLRGMVSAWRRLGALQGDAAGRARLVVGTGGYASGLALGWAAAHRVPYVLQEQNSHPGLTMRLFARGAREVYLGFPEAATSLRTGRETQVIDAGNPIEPPLHPRPSREAARAAWRLPPADRVLLVFGGSQGARAINDAVAAWVGAAGLPAGLSLLWVTGKGTWERYKGHEGPRVRVVPYVSAMREAYAAADLAISRAGAMGTAELCAWGIPMLLVPLPTAAADHQTVNARALERAGAAQVLLQRDVTAAQLDASVRALLEDPARLEALADAARRRAKPDAAATIAHRIRALLERQRIRS
ncbi:MAG: UDP-N-acetylglucosamine--N-acetylmuramyl-(pentapeptide) pyrophosphoryl-undecaprenol N-acetylglucosamine transferase [Gemmatimonadaceae bacterium]